MAMYEIVLRLDEPLTEEEEVFLRQGRVGVLLADALADFRHARSGAYVEERYAWLEEPARAAKSEEVALRRSLAARMHNPALRAEVRHVVTGDEE